MFNIEKILKKYKLSFNWKIYNNENNDYDVLMDIFWITPELKRENRQYWGRELWMCWQLIITDLMKNTNKDFLPAERMWADEPADLFIWKYAIDTKYRLGSWDSWTLKKFKQYWKMLREKWYIPVMLILRTDNLPAAITALNNWWREVYTDKNTFAFILKHSGVDFCNYLEEQKNLFNIW